jgi:hypothetical protein
VPPGTPDAVMAQTGMEKMKKNFNLLNLMRSYLIKGVTVPLVAIKYPTISTTLLKHLNRKKVKQFLVSNLDR